MIGRAAVSRDYRGFSVSPMLLIMAINVLVFIPTLINPGLIFATLGLVPALFPVQPWTIVTSLFVHGGFGHIIANMITLFFFGGFISRLIGRKGFLLVYFLGGIVGNIFYLLFVQFWGGMSADAFYIFRTSPWVPVVGASGAIFALGGTLAVLRPGLRVFVFPIPLPLPLWVAVIGGFLLLSLLPQVAWQAHLGGLVFGLMAGLLFRSRQRYYR